MSYSHKILSAHAPDFLFEQDRRDHGRKVERVRIVHTLNHYADVLDQAKKVGE